MKIRSRIAYGYAVVLGLACFGTAVGLAVGNHYQRNAFESRKVATAQRKLLTDMQVRILSNRPAKQLSPYLDDSVGFQEESQSLLDRITSIQVMLQDYKNLQAQELDTTTQQPDELNALLSEYEVVVARFYERTQTFIQEINSLSKTPGDLEQAKQQLLAFVQSPEFLAFIEFPDQLEPFLEQADVQEQQAETALQRAEVLRVWIILASLLTSMAIAAGIALITSRAIAKPIQETIDVARQVTEESNFDLQIAVHDEGEAGVLAKSFNMLIHQVKHLLEELQQKNTDLEEALARLSHQQLQLVQSEKMSSLGQLVAGVAHEINNPVNFIHGNLPHVHDFAQDLLDMMHLYQKHYPNPDAELQAAAKEIDLQFIQTDLPKMLDSIQVGTNRIRHIVMSLRNFSRMDEAEFKPVDIHTGIDSTLMILQHRLKDKAGCPPIQVHKDYGDLPLVECYAGQLNQVFMNILTNAIDAIDEENVHESNACFRDHPGQITIRTSVLRSDWIEIAIADNGPGIPEDVQRRIFDPFFTTKPVGKGTGIGMSLSYQIITEKHNGKLECHSKPGKGAEFIIQIPIRQEHPAAT